MKNRLFFLGFFSAFIPFLNAISYFSIFKKYYFRESIIFYLVLIYVLSVLVYGIFFFDKILTLSAVRFYFGFLVFYVAFKYSDFIFSDTHFRVLCALIILEAVLINTIIDPYVMPNFPDASAYSHFNLGGYQRPYSFSGNASVTSLLMVVLFSLLRFRIGNLIALSFCIAVLSSGVGILSYLILLLSISISFFSISSFFVFMFLSLLLFAFYIFSDVFPIADFSFLSSKISNDYICFLIDFKIDQIKDIYSGFTSLDFFMGNIDNYKRVGMGGDFGWLYFMSGFGFSGLTFIFSFLLCKLNKNNCFPLIMMVIFTLHYPAMFFLAGQVVFGYVLNYKRNTLPTKSWKNHEYNYN
ncbi:hypothetical protein [Vibrio cholerae]|uniref:Uncharacterized protein n=3 Tax=Vibrio cholerae TaxID=666 RepID=A0A7Z7YFV9_VIBCL|nr:hypothetical protein [Vibrio cholerae]TBM44718.1 hypothetical protein EYB64_05125 [Vibrio cholerae]CQB50485.1 hypothetical protein [Vibrio cholerae]